ncbi:MAG TPA: arylsulfotransferase family protein [Solirubrobacteraceae bacterium]|nr:arylsulfotransferase family protein [Solirubrobacteraceae bacterium]
MTRRQVLAAGLGGAVALAGAGLGVDRLLGGGGNGLPSNGTARRFVSAPGLHPTVVRYRTSPAASPGLMFVGPDRSPPVQAGAMILDGSELVWFHPVPYRHWVTNLQVRSWRGEPVLTWWQGRLDGGYGIGEAIIADPSYRELHRVRAANGRRMDLHEFQLTPEGTALFTCTPETVTVDLSRLGGPHAAHALESIIQEVDVVSGRLLMEWRSLRHIPLEESYRTEFAPFDYLHVNSIDVLPDGDLLICARNTWAAYKLRRGTGDVVWRLGGKQSDFRMEGASQFAWAHDARWIGNGQMTIFDDGFDGRTKSHKLSRALVLDVDLLARRVRVGRSYTSPARLLTSSMGNVQLLPDGHLFVGFGNDPYSTEFAPDGQVVANLEMPVGQHSYRAYRFPWQGHGEGRPRAGVRTGGDGRLRLYVSWNGTTMTTRWRVLAGRRLRRGSRAVDLRSIAEAPRTGFETAIELGRGSGVLVAVALDAAGRELGRSAPVTV